MIEKFKVGNILKITNYVPALIGGAKDVVEVVQVDRNILRDETLDICGNANHNTNTSHSINLTIREDQYSSSSPTKYETLVHVVDKEGQRGVFSSDSLWSNCIVLPPGKCTELLYVE